MEARSTISSRRDEILNQLNRITSSPILHGAESLCKLFAFLVTHTLDHPSEGMKEFVIATNVFGRDAEFDPRIDPIVRVQVGRLRSKLIEYYATDGVHDDVLIEIPKGSYAPSFRHRSGESVEEPRVERTAEEPTTASAPPTSTPAVASPAAAKRWLIPLWIALGVVCGVAGYAGWRAIGARAAVPELVRQFWRPYLDGAAPPLVVFSNAVFVGDSVNGLRYYDPRRDSSSDVLDHYTGTGEVLSIHALDQLFLGLGVPVSVKRSRLLNWDDARNRGVIFIGAVSENLPLRELSWQEDFAFPPLTTANDDRRRTITNLHPKPGEPVEFVGRPNAIDYAVINRSISAGEIRAMLVLAGMNTVGTQAATEFVCSPAGLEKLAAHVPLNSEQRFSALLEVTIKGGVPFETRIVTVHVHER